MIDDRFSARPRIVLHGQPYHAVARCLACAWVEEDHVNAERLATIHVRSTGHPVDLVIGRQLRLEPG